jgi:tight adherence protein C
VSIDLIVGLTALFVGVATLVGLGVAAYLARYSPERRRLGHLTAAMPTGVVVDATTLTETASPTMKRLSSMVPKSPKELSQLRRRLTTAGYRTMNAAIWFSVAKLVCPVVAVLAALTLLPLRQGWIAAILAGMVGVMLPELWLSRQTRRRQKVIRNGLPDALDLIIVCLEAGSSLDQAIMKTSDELAVAYPALAEELRLVTTEIRAGKPRIEAMKNFAERTRVDDVRALVAMLVQTDRFGTSVAQALRTHADTARTKRRQNAEERAAKLSVKLVFPLVFCLFPALYTVILGPAVIRIFRVFSGAGVVENIR